MSRKEFGASRTESRGRTPQRRRRSGKTRRPDRKGRRCISEESGCAQRAAPGSGLRARWRPQPVWCWSTLPSSPPDRRSRSGPRSPRSRSRYFLPPVFRLKSKRRRRAPRRCCSIATPTPSTSLLPNPRCRRRSNRRRRCARSRCMGRRPTCSPSRPMPGAASRRSPDWRT